jgi:hypothetical protein
MHPLEPHLTEMNESLVRERIVSPFIERLGYGVAGPERVRHEKPLKYSLGRKKKTDRVQRGRCDYVCEVESYGRWVIEANGGSETLITDDAEQAHTYAHHPAVGGFFYMVTNGGLFRLYDRDPNRPIMEWTLSEMDAKWPTIENLLGPDAIRRRARSYEIDIGKPLAQGLGSKATIVGGFLTYDEYKVNNPEAAKKLEQITGLRGTFTGGEVIRTETGLIRARVVIVGPYKEWDDLNKAAGITGYDFESAVESISTDPDQPTIFQGTMKGKLDIGQVMRLPGLPPQRLPMGIIMTARTEAVGFIERDRFKGTFRIAHDHALNEDQPLDLSLIEGPERAQIDMLLKVQPRDAVEAMMRQILPGVFSQMHVTSEGSFEIVVH